MNIDQITNEMGRDWVNLFLAIPWIFCFILMLGNLIFALSIKEKLRVLYPPIWKKIQCDQYPYVNSNRSMRALNKVIFNPPREITDKSVLKDFTLCKRLQIALWITFLLGALATFCILKSR